MTARKNYKAFAKARAAWDSAIAESAAQQMRRAGLIASFELAASCSFLVTTVKLNRETLEHANYFLKMRGPDKTNVLHRHGVSYVHNLLHMTGAFTVQPFQNGELVAVFNGEIYNFRELSSQFGLAVPPSDGHVILPLYRRVGAAFVQLLRGEFALVVADVRRGTLVIATDTFGTKPLWVAQGGHMVGDESMPLHFGVGSYASALERLSLTHGLRQLRSNTIEVRNLTTFELLEALPVFTFDLTQHKTDYKDWDAAFETAMRRRTSGLLHGTFVGLSSGVDSGLIALALVQLNISHHIYSIENSEDLLVLRTRHRFARGHGAAVHSLIFTKEDAVSSKRWMLDHVEKYEFAGVHHSDWEYNVTDPQKIEVLDRRQAELRAGVHNDPGSIGLSHICGQARALGIKIYLSGAGVDEIYSDYEGRSLSIFSTFGGRFPSDLASIFPWPNFFYGAQRDFLRKEEHVAGAHGVEGRYPFLDVDLVQEFLWLKPALKSAPRRHGRKVTGFKLPLIAALEKAFYPYTPFKRGFNAVKGISSLSPG